MVALEQVMAATRHLFAATGCGIMLINDTSALAAVAATDEPGRLLEVVQERVGHGPCVDALTFDRTIDAGDLAADERWPELSELPSTDASRSGRAAPRRPRASGIAERVSRPSSRMDRQRGVCAQRLRPSLVEGLLQTALHARERERLAEQLQHALDHRVVIERAVGIVMGRQNVNAVDAFNQLRHRARSAQRPVADVARELLAEIPGNPD